MELEEKINRNSKGIEVALDNGAYYENTFYVIDTQERNGQELFLLESEENGDEQPGIIVDKYNNVILEDVYNGFRDYDEQIEDKVEVYDLQFPEEYKNITITKKYVLPYSLEFTDKNSNKYEVYQGNINDIDDNDTHIIIKSKEGQFLYSEKLDIDFMEGNIELSKANFSEYDYKVLVEKSTREKESASIFNIRVNDEERWFKNTSELDAEGLCKAYAECGKPLVEMEKYGEQIEAADYAHIEQGDKLDFSIEFNEETDQITIFDGENFEHKGLRETLFLEKGETYTEVSNSFDNNKKNSQQETSEAYLKTPHSEENKNQEDEKIKEALIRGVGAVMSSNEFATYSKTINKLMYNNYSPRNCSLILNQFVMKYCEKNDIDILKLSNEEMGKKVIEALKSEDVPSYMMGYEAWKEYGRQVKGKGVAYSIIAPNYVNEYNGKGTILKAMKKKFQEQYKKDRNINYAEFKLGKTGLTFRGYANELVDVCMNGKTIIGKQTIEDIRKFLDNDVIGKMPNGYSVTYVYDVKNTVVPEYLWVKSGYKKDELVLDENNNPVQRKPYKNSNVIEYKIRNTEERKSKFNPELSMEVKGITEEKAEILFEALKETSEKKGVPINIEDIKGEARGFFKSDTKKIAVSNKLDNINKCATGIHEMAHSDLHAKVSDKSRNMKEVEAEAVSYIVSQHFGINTDVKSFNYLASWSTGRDLRELENSMSLILNESKKLEREIEKTLNEKGYNINLEKIGLETEERTKYSNDNLKENTEEYLKSYKEYVLTESVGIEKLKSDAKELLKKTEDTRCINIISEQINNLNKQNRKVQTIDNNIEKIANGNSEQKDISVFKERIEKMYMDNQNLKTQFSELAYEYSKRIQELQTEEQLSLRESYNVNPVKTIKDYIQKSDNETFKKLDDMSIDYIAKSKYFNDKYNNLIKDSMDNFMQKAVDRINEINKVKSKDGQFIEINFCEKWFDEPIVKNGALLHPQKANEIFKEAEKDIEKLKNQALENDDYIPYSKCKMTIFTENKDVLFATNTRLDIGDGYQTDLSDFLHKECKDNFVLAAYDKSLKESIKNKVVIVEMPELENTNEVNKNQYPKEMKSDELKDYVNNTNSECENGIRNRTSGKQKEYEQSR